MDSAVSWTLFVRRLTTEQSETHCIKSLFSKTDIKTNVENSYAENQSKEIYENHLNHRLMTSRMGFLLERNVKKLFELSGFKPEVNKIIGDYEIDVYVKYRTIDLVVECKQYERSALALRNLIHQWDSKNKEIKATKILLVVVGIPISERDLNLAKKYGIAIWDEKKLSELLDEAIEKRDQIKSKVLLEAGLKGTKEIDEEIKNIRKKYDCSRTEATMLLRGELTEEKLKRKKEFEKALSESEKRLSPEDSRLLGLNSKYYGFPFEKVFEMMVKYKIPDKRIARLFVNSKGGRFAGKNYSGIRIRKMKLIIEQLNCSFEEADSKPVDYITFPELKRIIRLKTTRKELSFEEAKDLILKKEPSITQTRKIEAKQEERPQGEKKQKRSLLRRLLTPKR